MALTKFSDLKAGQRVVVNGHYDGQMFTNEVGVVRSCPDYMNEHVLIRFDRPRTAFHDGNGGDNQHHWYFTNEDKGVIIEPEHRSTYLNGLEFGKQERYLTAYKDGPDFSLTGDNYFNTQQDADNAANALAASEADVTVVVLKVVSQHSSRIVVTSETA